jgi:predicted metalloprotease with PDZ domain
MNAMSECGSRAAALKAALTRRTPKLAVLLLLFAVRAFAADPATIFVDATDARRGVFHSHLTIPATPGAMTLVYPKWIPGEHMPTGPLMQMAGLHVRAGNNEIAWKRDGVDVFAFHVDVPASATALDVDFDYLSPSATFAGGYGESANATQSLLLILFNHHVVYRGGTPTDQLIYRASVRLPAGWKFDTALPIAAQNGDRIDFTPVSLTTLVDSPIVAGAFTKTIPAGDAQHIFLTADSASALAMPDARIANVRSLVAETDALFGARHYRRYTWLVTLSDIIEMQGLEHHESTDIRGPEHGFTDADWAARVITILSHEFVHSWNGKYRRPAGLATPDYQASMVGELLYVYEGMTRYLGDLVLTARSGMRTMDEDREYAAWVSANQDRNRPGRNWRPLADTAVAVQSIGMAPSEEVPYRRALDYYDESMLLWLDADSTIRSLSGGKKSLDDFAKLFFGSPLIRPSGTFSPPSGEKGTRHAHGESPSPREAGRGWREAPSEGPSVKPYTLDDVITALNTIAAYDWRGFLDTRVYRVAPHPPLQALEATGWRLVYNDTPNWYQSLRERTTKQTDVSFSLGMWIKNDGTIADVVHSSPAYNAGLMPGMKINAVGGRKYAGDVLREEIRAKKPLDVSVEQGSFAGSFRIDYSDGERFPHLERIAAKPDLLSDIMRPHAK